MSHHFEAGGPGGIKKARMVQRQMVRRFFSINGIKRHLFMCQYDVGICCTFRSVAVSRLARPVSEATPLPDLPKDSSNILAI